MKTTKKPSRASRRAAPPCWAMFHGNGGYPVENMRARSTLELGMRYRVIGGRMSQCSTLLELRGVRGLWNSVMFRVTGKMPIENPYLPNTALKGADEGGVP